MRHQSAFLKEKRHAERKYKRQVKLNSFVFWWADVGQGYGADWTPAVRVNNWWGMVNCLNVSTASEPSGQEGWERHLVLCKELSRRQSASQRGYKNSPGVTALAISR